MPTIFTHAFVGAAVAQTLAPCTRRREVTVASAVCAMVPDADVLGFGFGILYGDLFGHRGFTHSLFFAGVVTLCAAAICWTQFTPAERLRTILCVFAATASHGLLDAFTNGGMGVAFWAPFSATRYFFPVTPIEVSPIGLGFFSQRGMSTLASEMAWVWAPAACMILAARLTRCRRVEAPANLAGVG